MFLIFDLLLSLNGIYVYIVSGDGPPIKPFVNQSETYLRTHVKDY